MQTSCLSVGAIGPVVGDISQDEETIRAKHAKHLVQGARPFRRLRQVVNDLMRNHRIEACVRIGQRPGVAGLDLPAFGDAFTPSISDGGFRGIVGLVLGSPEVDANRLAAG